jgi:hypothetical protein
MKSCPLASHCAYLSTALARVGLILLHRRFRITLIVHHEDSLFIVMRKVNSGRMLVFPNISLAREAAWFQRSVYGVSVIAKEYMTASRTRF